MENNRVCCLYRVSTDKQVDYDTNHEADIPMQTAYPVTRSVLKTVTKYRLSKSLPARASSISCLCLCLTESGVSPTKRRLL